jgi:ArsR family transcriptional regulator
MREFMTVVRALSDENRVRVLLALKSGELCVCRIIGLLRLAPSTVSKHMALLHAAGLVSVRRDGRWRYYRLPARTASPVVRNALRWTLASLKGDEIASRDARRLETVLRRRAGTCAT